ncbi:hypothetical protein OU415_20900 [Saccharopolyspora sp. WRP15-2]|uniref:WXG100 family type VII secretion target n=1 Tax=Saccharopolyspora oryzae TaxID=2997343 RepID=A0ABT4V1S5_9PSEU|nr:hypothetical protein [Saccharopolyspora oryzae]MDA3627905.1 hypothetical protein [Saccharopolyspora oryzae]
MNSVLPSDQPIRDRNDLAGPGSPSWIEDAGISVGGVSPSWDVVRGGTTTVTNNGQSSTLTVQIWVKLNWGLLRDNYTLQQLFGLGEQWLDPLVRGGANSVTRQPSFGELADTLEGARDFLDRKRDDVASWAKQIESGGELEGATATAVQNVLQSLSKQIGAFSAEISDSVLVGQLRESGTKLGTELNQLLDKFIDWRNGSAVGNADAWTGWNNNKNYADPVGKPGGEEANLSNPAHAVAAALNKYQLSVNIGYNQQNGSWDVKDVDFGLGDARDGAALKENLDKEAKQEWLNYFAAKLDPGTDSTFNDVQSEYQSTKNNMPQQPKFGPVGAGGGDQPPGGGNGNGGGSGADQNVDIPPTDTNTDVPPTDTNTDVPPTDENSGDQNVDVPPTDENSGDQNVDVPPTDENSGDQNVDVPPTDENSDGQDFDAPDTDLDGQDDANGGKGSLTDPNNHGGGQTPPPPPPVTTFNPSQFTPNGMNNLFPNSGGGSGVVGPDGKLLTKPDGSPLNLPPGAKINPDGTVTKADGTQLRDANGNLVKVPPGSSIQPDFPPGSVVNPDGTVTTPDGTQLRDSHGNVVKVPPNSIYHPNSSNSSFYPPLGKMTLPPDLHTSGNKFSSYNPSGLETTKRGGFGSAEINDPTRRSTVNSSALDDALRKPTNPATESSFKGGKGGAGGQQPMMPPPMAGGAGGGDQNKDRQRTTWLSEDADTWNTDEGFSGAIGR